MLEDSNKQMQQEINKLNAQLSTEKTMKDFNVQQQKKYENQLKSLQMEGSGSID